MADWKHEKREFALYLINRRPYYSHAATPSGKLGRKRLEGMGISSLSIGH